MATRKSSNEGQPEVCSVSVNTFLIPYQESLSILKTCNNLQFGSVCLLKLTVAVDIIQLGMLLGGWAPMFCKINHFLLFMTCLTILWTCSFPLPFNLICCKWLHLNVLCHLYTHKIMWLKHVEENAFTGANWWIKSAHIYLYIFFPPLFVKYKNWQLKYSI